MSLKIRILVRVQGLRTFLPQEYIKHFNEKSVTGFPAETDPCERKDTKCLQIVMNKIMVMLNALELKNITKSFGDLVAVNNISLNTILFSFISEINTIINRTLLFTSQWLDRFKFSAMSLDFSRAKKGKIAAIYLNFLKPQKVNTE